MIDDDTPERMKENQRTRAGIHFSEAVGGAPFQLTLKLDFATSEISTESVLSALKIPAVASIENRRVIDVITQALMLELARRSSGK